jgi:protoporphyrinogen oxidase
MRSQSDGAACRACRDGWNPLRRAAEGVWQCHRAQDRGGGRTVLLSSRRLRIAVIGAGVTGLTAAHRLAAHGHEVVVLERWPGLGGQAATFDAGEGALLERYYHHLFTSDRHIADLCSEIGVGDELETWPSSVGMFSEGRLHPFTTPGDLLRYKPLSPLARVRMGVGVVLLQRLFNDVRPLERLTIKEWVEKWMGPQAWEKVWSPLMRGKFGDKADQVSMGWLWAKLRARRQTSGEEAKQELLVYPRNSFEAIFRRLRDRIEVRGGEVRIDSPAARLASAGHGFLVWSGAPDSFQRGHDPRGFEASPEPERFDAVIATTPTDIFEQLLDEDLRAAVGDDYMDRVGAIEYYEALVLVLELDRRFHPYYWTNVADDELPFIGVIEHTNLVGSDRYGGRHFLYVANYLPHGHELLGLDMDALLDAYEPGLSKVSAGFSRDWIKRSWRFVEPAAQPVVLRDYPRRMPPYETGVDGLLLANTTQVYPEDRGTNYAVREGEEVAAALLAQKP